MTGRDMRLAPALVAALLPFAASAIDLTVNGSRQDVRIGGSQCKSLTLTARWDLQGPPQVSDRTRVVGARSGSGACSTPDTITAPDHVFVSEHAPTAQTESTSIPAQDMVLATPTDAGVQPCDDPDVALRSSANPLTNTLCVQRISVGSLGGRVLQQVASLNVKYALAPPFPPGNVQITPGNNHLKIFWSKGDDAEDIAEYDVHVFPDGAAPGAKPIQTVTATNADVDKTDDGLPLVNGSPYLVTLVAKDTYGNVSEPSVEAPASPVATADFYNHYRDLGGDAKGGNGCTSTGAAPWIAGLAIALGALLRRRAKARNGAALIAAIALLTPAARAEERRPRRFLIGFKLDRYTPQVDSEPGLQGTPYRDIFGARHPFRYQLELDWAAAHPLGSILLGVTVGFWQNYGKALLRDPAPGQPPQSGDTTLLNVWPFGLVATYRFDWLADRWPRFPFIPYAQAGLMRALWVSYGGSGGVSVDRTNGGRGSGWTSGYTTALGVAVNLNAIDEELSREAYMETGIQRTALFAEYGWTYLSNFGGGGVMILSDRGWRFGLSVEF